MENLVRSAMAPDTMVALVAQNTVWKISSPSVGSPLALWYHDRSPKFGMPIKPAPSEPYIMPKPTNQKSTEPIMKSTKFLNKMFAVFFRRVNPASHRAKPGCMKNTRAAASNSHKVSTDIPKSCIVIVVIFL